MLDYTNRGWALVIPGAILAGYALIKAVIIGYYPWEAVPTALVALAGAGLLFAAEKLGKNPPKPHTLVPPTQAPPQGEGGRE